MCVYRRTQMARMTYGMCDGIEREVDCDHLEQMLIFKMESAWVRTCVNMLSSALLRYGVGAYFGDEHMKELPQVFARWIRSRMTNFVREAVGYLSCIGFCIYEINVEDMDVVVTDPRLVYIEMKRLPGEPLKYKITPRNYTPGKSPVQYYIQVMDAPDVLTGLVNGVLPTIVMQYQAVVVTTRNMVVRDTGNAGTFLWQETHGSKTEATFLDIPNESTAIFGGNGATIAGVSRGGDVVREARDDYVESTFMLDQRVIRNMGLEKVPPMYGMWTRMRVAEVNPNNVGIFPVRAGAVLRQRAYPPSNQDYCTAMLHMERVIVSAFGLAYSMVEAHTGNHSAAVDTENAQLQAACEQYRNDLAEMLETVSTHLFEWAYEEGGGGISAILARMSPGDTTTALSKKARLATTELERVSEAAGEPLSLRIVSTLPLQEVLRGYENGIFRHEALIECYGMARGCAPSMFETRDVRPIMTMQEGPGHHGTSTLTKSPRSSQRQTTNPTATSKRKRALPGPKSHVAKP